MVERNETRTVPGEKQTELKNPEPKPLPLAVRVYPESSKADQKAKSRRPLKRPDAMLVFDTETRIDATQRLTFGSFRFIVGGRCVEEGLFYADDLPDGDRGVLERYVIKHRHVLLLSRREFLDKFYNAAYKGRCLVVGFNLPFDLSC